MTILEAIILGIIQGLTEFLPVSSSGHIELGKYFLGSNFSDNLFFSLLLHLGTVLSTIVVFRKDILEIIYNIFGEERNSSLRFIFQILISMIPVFIVGIFFKSEAEQFFNGDIKFVGFMLLVTGMLLLLSNIGKWKNRDISNTNAFIIGIAQAIAVLPGISRSGATIATGLILGVKKNEIARFSFLMVIPPIIGASILDLKDVFENEALMSNLNWPALVAGFTAAFVTGLVACKLMIKIVSTGKLAYFAIYCFIVGLIAIFFS